MVLDGKKVCSIGGGVEGLGGSNKFETVPHSSFSRCKWEFLCVRNLTLKDCGSLMLF